MCGNIVVYSTDSIGRSFRLEYDCEDDAAPTVIYVPNKGYLEFENKIGKNIITLNY